MSPHARIPLAILLCAAPARAEGRWLELYGTTDRHGHLEPERVHLPAEGAAARVTVDVGGAALLGGYLANARAAAPGRTLLVDAGDLFQGTVVSNQGEGAAVVRALNALGYAAAAVGNHEFDFGPEGPHATARDGEDLRGALKARARQASFALLSANVIDDHGPLFLRYTVTTVDGVRVGIVGGLSEDSPRTTIRPNLIGLRVLPLGRAIADAAAAARAAGATIVVAVVHAGGECPHTPLLSDAAPGTRAGCEDGSELFQVARTLQAAARAGGGRVDALFGGHTHKTLTAVVDGLPVAQAAPLGFGLAEIDLEVDAAGKPTGHFRIPPLVELCAATVNGSCDPRHARPGPLVPARYRDRPVTPDGAVTAAFAADVAAAAAARAVPVGVTLASAIPRAFTSESPLGNLVADVIRAATHADLALTNGGGLRADLPAGALTYGRLFEALPFENKLATFTLDGATLRRLITRNLEHERGILSLSGGRVHAACRAGALQVELTFDDGRRLDDAARYRIGTTDFLALGGDDFGALALPHDAITVDDNAVLRDTVGAWLARRTTPLGGDDRALFDPAHRRFELPAARPIRCTAQK